MHYNVETTLQGPFELHGKVEMTVRNDGSTPLQSIPIELWINAYQPRLSFLAKERLEDQKTDLFYAPEALLGHTDSLNFSASLGIDSIGINPSGEVYLLQLTSPLLPQDSVLIQTTFRSKLPSAEFNGFGYDPFTIRLSQWFPKVSGMKDGKFYPTQNSRLRYENHNPSSIEATLTLHAETEVIASQEFSSEVIAEQKKIHFPKQNCQDLVVILSPQLFAFHVPKMHTPETDVYIHYNNELPPIDFITGFQRISAFMKDELNASPPPYLHLAFLAQKKAFRGSGQLLVIEPRRQIRRHGGPDRGRMGAHVVHRRHPCQCRPTPVDGGWNGALLQNTLHPKELP